jgi:hypothetical protein
VNIREAEVATLVADGQAQVINAAELQYRGVEIMHIHVLTVFKVAVTKFVGVAPGGAGFCAAASQPDPEPLSEIIAAGSKTGI